MPLFTSRVSRSPVCRARPQRRNVAARWLPSAVAAAALAIVSAGPAAASSGWQWPLAPAHVLRGFDPPDGPYGPGHRGVDLAAQPGQTVSAPAPGTVSFAGLVAGVHIVVITHGVLRSTFEPVINSVERGQHVEAGDQVGVVATGTFHCLAVCVHWGVLDGDEYVDPVTLISVEPPRLLPYWDVPPPRQQQPAPPERQSAVATADEPFAGGWTPPATESLVRSGQGTTDGRRDDPSYPPERPAARSRLAATSHRVPTQAVAAALSLGTGAVLAWLVIVLVRRRM